MVALFGFVLLLMRAAFAVEVQLALDTDTLVVGQTARLQLVVVDAPQFQVPQIQAPDGLRLHFSSQYSRPTSTPTGVVRLTVVEYRLEALRAGEYTLGPYEVRAGPTVATTRTAHLLVRDARSTGPPDLEVEAELLPEAAWEGQLVELRYRLKRRIETLGGARWDFDTLEGLAEPRDTTRPQRTYTIDDPNGRIDVEERILALIAEEPGKHQYRSAIVEVLVRPPGAPAPRSPFARALAAERRTLVTDPLAIEVKPLPPPPPGFTGLVGEFRFTSALTAPEVRVGGSVAWDIAVEGNGTLEDFAIPTLPEVEGVRFYDSGTRADARIDESGSYAASGVFTRVVVGTAEGVVQLPPLDLVTFSPERGAYVTDRIEVPPLRVLPGREGSGQVQSFAKTVLFGPEEDPVDLADIRRSGALTLWWPMRHGTWGLPLLGVPGLIVVGLAGLRNVRQRVTRWIEARKALPVDARTRLKRLPAEPTERLAALDMALRQALAERAGVPVQHLQRSAPTGLPPELLTEVQAITHRLDRARFAGEVAEDLTAPVADLVHRILGLPR